MKQFNVLDLKLVEGKLKLIQRRRLILFDSICPFVNPHCDKDAKAIVRIIRILPIICNFDSPKCLREISRMTFNQCL